MSEGSTAIFKKHWDKYYCESDPIVFQNKMNIIQKELIEHHYLDMDVDTRLRAKETLKILDNKISKATSQIEYNNSIKDVKKKKVEEPSTTVEDLLVLELAEKAGTLESTNNSKIETIITPAVKTTRRISTKPVDSVVTNKRPSRSKKVEVNPIDIDITPTKRRDSRSRRKTPSTHSDSMEW